MPGDRARVDPRLAGLELAAAVVAGDARNENAQAREQDEHCSDACRAAARDGSQETRPESGQAERERQEAGNHDPRLLCVERSQGADVFAARAVRLCAVHAASHAALKTSGPATAHAPARWRSPVAAGSACGWPRGVGIESGRYTSAPSEGSGRMAEIVAVGRPSSHRGAPRLSHQRRWSPPHERPGPPRDCRDGGDGYGARSRAVDAPGLARGQRGDRRLLVLGPALQALRRTAGRGRGASLRLRDAVPRAACLAGRHPPPRPGFRAGCRRRRARRHRGRDLERGDGPDRRRPLDGDREHGLALGDGAVGRRAAQAGRAAAGRRRRGRALRARAAPRHRRRTAWSSPGSRSRSSPPRSTAPTSWSSSVRSRGP